MNLYVRNFLLWLLTFAIPVQGFTAAQMTYACSHQMPATHVAVSTVSSAIENTHTGHAMQELAQVDSDMADHAAIHQHKVSCAPCSSCVACAIGASLPPALDLGIALLLTPDIHITSSLHGYVGFTPENPERPPSPLA